MKVLVTGGTGFLGRALQKVKPDWLYQGEDDSWGYNLIDYVDAVEMIVDHQPDAIVHLAAKVGGIKANAENPATFFYENLMINTNVIQAAANLNVPRVLSAASTCAFPDTIEEYPMFEDELHDGPPTKTNLGYGYAKRMLIVHTNACRKQYALDYSTFSPTNLYGPDDNFDLETSHFISALIRKVAEAKNGETIEFYGTGRPLKQELYVEDLARIIPKLLELHHSDVPVIVAPKENISVREYIDIVLKISGKDLKIKFNGELEGQYRKDGNNDYLLEAIGDFKFTPIEEGLRTTYEWYLKQKGI